jgi:hypothetical protein
MAKKEFDKLTNVCGLNKFHQLWRTNFTIYEIAATLTFDRHAVSKHNNMESSSCCGRFVDQSFSPKKKKDSKRKILRRERERERERFTYILFLKK